MKVGFGTESLECALYLFRALRLGEERCSLCDKLGVFELEGANDLTSAVTYVRLADRAAKSTQFP